MFLIPVLFAWAVCSNSLVHAKQEQNLKYYLRVSESLVDVLERLDLIPIDGHGGYLKQTLQLNPHIDRVFEKRTPFNTWIKLPVTKLPPSDTFFVEKGVVVLRKLEPRYKVTATFTMEDGKTGKKQRFEFGGKCPHPSQRQKWVDFNGNYRPKLEDETHPFDVEMSVGCPTVGGALTNTRGNRSLSAATPSRGGSDFSESVEDLGPSWWELIEHDLKVGARTPLSDVQSTAGTGDATIVSDVGYGVDLEFEQGWNEKFKTFLSYGVDQLSYAPPSGFTFNQGDNFLHRAAVGVHYKVIPKLTLSSHFGFRQRQILYIPDPNQVSLIAELIWEGMLSAQYNIAKLFGFDLIGKLGGGVLLPKDSTNYSLNIGFQGHGIIELQRNVSGANQYGINFFFEDYIQSSSLLDQFELRYGLGLFYRWRL